MDDCTLLDVADVPDADVVEVPADHCIVPHTDLPRQGRHTTQDTMVDTMVVSLPRVTAAASDNELTCCTRFTNRPVCLTAAN